MKIWQRYFYKEIITTFAFLLSVFYALYIVLDLMAHIKDLREGNTSLMKWIVFYLCTLSRRLDVLLPFVVLIGSARVLLYFQTHHVFSSLLTGGLSVKKLYQPFLVVCGFCSLLMYANYEWILPKALPRALFIQENNFEKKSFTEKKTPFHECTLKDGSKMLYRTYNPTLGELQDVFWIASLDKIYHMKKLLNLEGLPKGLLVDEIIRNNEGFLQKSACFQEFSFSKLHVNDETLKSSVIQARDQSLTQLASEMSLYDPRSDKGMDIKANFVFKLTFPLMTLLAFLAVAPFCLRFVRGIPYLMIYLIGISALFCFLLLLQVAFVFAKSLSFGIYLLLFVWLIAFYLASKCHVIPNSPKLIGYIS